MVVFESSRFYIFSSWADCTAMRMCIQFSWQGFGSGGATGVASVRSCEKLPPCPTEPTPASSKMDLLLARAEPISDSSSASVRTHLRMGRKPCIIATSAGESNENV